MCSRLFKPHERLGGPDRHPAVSLDASLINTKKEYMSTIEKYIDVNVLAETSYDQWRQFEKRPEFLELVKQVHEPDESSRHWKPEIADQDTAWNSEITCQTPYHRTDWVSQAGAFTEGVVSLHAVSDVRSRVLIQVHRCS